MVEAVTEGEQGLRHTNVLHALRARRLRGIVPVVVVVVVVFCVLCFSIKKRHHPLQPGASAVHRRSYPIPVAGLFRTSGQTGYTQHKKIRPTGRISILRDARRKFYL